MSPPAQLTLAKQRELCVTDGHSSCATYMAAMAADAALPGRADESLLWPATVPVLTALEPTHAHASVAFNPPRASGQALLVALMLVALVVLVLAKTASPFGGSAATAPSMTPPDAPASAVAASATPSPSPTPLASVEVTPSPAPSASSAAPSTTPSPSASTRTYKVRSGDTLAVIAAKFHTTVKAIVAANSITDPRTIHPGQVLVIP